MQAKKEAGSLSLALLSPLRETLGTQRIVLQLSFPEYFSFFFPPPSRALLFLPEQKSKRAILCLCGTVMMTSERSKMAAQIGAVVTPEWAEQHNAAG